MVEHGSRESWVWLVVVLLCVAVVGIGHHFGLDRWLDGEYKLVPASVKFTPSAHQICKAYIMQYSDKSNDMKTLAYWTNLDACVYGVEMARGEAR